MIDLLDERPLTTGDIAKYCHVTPVAVLKWIKAGKLKAYATPGGHFRVTPDEFKEFLKRYVMPMPRAMRAREENHVLVADDDSAILTVVSKSLKKLDGSLHVHTAENGYEACVRIGHFPVSLAIIDIMMPNMDGIEVCRILRSMPETKDIPILIISGFLDEENIEALNAIGVNDFLAKPFKAKELNDVATRILGR